MNHYVGNEGAFHRRRSTPSSLKWTETWFNSKSKGMKCEIKLENGLEPMAKRNILLFRRHRQDKMDQGKITLNAARTFLPD